MSADSRDHLGVYKQYDLDPPDWASDRLEGAGNTATALLEDPLLIVEGISQGATDAVEQKAAGIGRHQDLSGDTVSTYQAGSISDLLAFQNASLRNGLQKNYITQTCELVENSEAIYTQRQEAWEEAVRQRKEQAERYLRFLENGSMEGLTDAEIAAIWKVDEALVLHKVDGQSVLDLRNSMAGENSSVLESGGPTAIYGSKDIANYQYNMIENPGPLAEMPNQPASVTNVRIETAVKPQWIDPITGELTGEPVVDTVYANIY